MSPYQKILRFYVSMDKLSRVDELQPSYDLDAYCDYSPKSEPSTAPLK